MSDALDRARERIRRKAKAREHYLQYVAMLLGHLPSRFLDRKNLVGVELAARDARGTALIRMYDDEGFLGWITIRLETNHRRKPKVLDGQSSI